MPARPQGPVKTRERKRLPATTEVAADTKLAAVADAIRRRASHVSERRIKVTGAEIAKETGLRLDQIHDAIFALARKGVIKKERPGARFRPMILRLTEDPAVIPQPISGPTPAPAEIGLLSIRCPTCNHPIDLVEAYRRKSQELREAQQSLLEVRKIMANLE